MPPSGEEIELDTRIRQMPRTPETDPYQSGLEAVAAQLRVNLGDVLPETLDHLRPQYPGVELRYTRPFDLQLVANTLVEQVKRFS